MGDKTIFRSVDGVFYRKTVGDRPFTRTGHPLFRIQMQIGPPAGGNRQ